MDLDQPITEPRHINTITELGEDPKSDPLPGAAERSAMIAALQDSLGKPEFTEAAERVRSLGHDHPAAFGGTDCLGALVAAASKGRAQPPRCSRLLK